MFALRVPNAENAAQALIDFAHQRRWYFAVGVFEILFIQSNQRGDVDDGVPPDNQVPQASASTTAFSVRRRRVRRDSTQLPHSEMDPKRTKRRAVPTPRAFRLSKPRPQREQ